MATYTKQRAALLTQLESAQLLGISRQSLRRLIAAGSLEPVWIAGLGRPRFRRRDLERLIEGGRAP